MDQPIVTPPADRDTMLVTLGDLAATTRALLDAVERGNTQWQQLADKIDGVSSLLSDIEIKAEPGPEPEPEPPAPVEKIEIEPTETKPPKRKRTRAAKWLTAMQQRGRSR